MTCCAPNITAFSNVTSTSINYTPGMAALYGKYPKVKLLYYDPETQDYILATPLQETRVSFNGSRVYVDHGGPASGLIRIS